MTWLVDARLAHALLVVCQLTVFHLSLQCATVKLPLRLRCAAIGRTTLWKIGPQSHRQVKLYKTQNKVVKYLSTYYREKLNYNV